MRRLLTLVVASAIVLAACSSTKATPTPTPTPTPSPTPTSSPTPGPTAVDAGWIVWAPEGKGYTSKFPAAPTLTTGSVSTAAGPAPSYTWMYLESVHIAYSVALVKYPAGSLAGASSTAIYDASVASLGTLVTQTAVTVNGHAARSFTCTKPGITYKGVIVLVGDDLYMVYVVYDATVTDLTAADAFIADFTLTV